MTVSHSTAHAVCACGNPITKFFKSGKRYKRCAICVDKNAGRIKPDRASHCICGQMLVHTDGDRRPRRYCSDKCRWADSKRNLRKPAVERTFCCAYCERQFTTAHKRKFCSVKCLAGSTRQAEMDAYLAAHKAIGLVVVCRDCDCEFCPMPGVSMARVRCPMCFDELSETHWQHIRKRRIKAAFIEPVDRIKVFDRDGWVCRICGVKTIRKPYQPNSAELDHVVPIARGGEHSYQNTQCACRRCNGMKGAKAIEQAAPRGRGYENVPQSKSKKPSAQSNFHTNII